MISHNASVPALPALALFLPDIGPCYRFCALTCSAARLRPAASADAIAVDEHIRRRCLLVRTRTWYSHETQVSTNHAAVAAADAVATAAAPLRRH